MRTLIGHQGVLALLERTVKEGRPAHAYLFVGREGVGKKALAVRFACMLNCPAPDQDATHTCSTCRRIVEEKHPDVILERPEKGMIRIERVRNIHKFFRYPPVEARCRLVIIDDAHSMNRQAQNAMLKTLEEPPPGRILILVTAKPALLLPTVRSRCRRLTFGPIPLDPLARLIQERTDLLPEKARALVAMSSGSAGLAMEMVGPGYLELRDRVISTICDPGKGGIKGLLDLSLNISASRESALDAIEIASACIRDIVAAKITLDPSMLIHGDFLDIISSAAQHHSREELFEAYDELAKAAGLIDADINVNRNLVLDVMLLRIARILAGPTFGAGSVERTADGIDERER